MKELVVEGVTKSFGGLSVLRGVDLTVPEGSFTAILGSSGSGKTTLLRIVAGFERPDDGQIRLGSHVIDDAHHRFVPCERRRIGYVPQEGSLFPHLNVGRNVAFGLARDERRRDRVSELLELVGLTGLHRRYPHQLSGGQQQRVALARALATEPEVVLLDEPFSSLDASLRASVRAEVLEVLRLAGTTSILVTHDQDEALSMADQVAILRDGVIAQLDTPSGLYGHPSDAELAQFLGESNLVEGTVRGRTVETALGELEFVPSRRESCQGHTAMRANVLIRPEQLLIGETGQGAADGIVRSYEYFGHDAVVHVHPRDPGLPELVVRVTGGETLAPGTLVGLRVHGAVVAWPTGAGAPPPHPAKPEPDRPTAKSRE
jgi:iron(III) transport system ATP-binding protein